MNSIRYRVLTPPRLETRIKRMDDSQAKKYREALRMLEIFPLRKLLLLHKVQKLSYNTYLYRVGIRERILFTQHENTIIVIDIGETQEIVSKITRKSKPNNIRLLRINSIFHQPYHYKSIAMICDAFIIITNSPISA